MFGLGVKEIVIIALVIAVLNLTGVWPMVIRSFREIRGDIPLDDLDTPRGKGEIELSCKILGVSPHAEWTEIEKAYRAKARVHHPDKGGDADAMRALNDAYRLLKQVRKSR